jgi:hypothetical protein
MAVMFGRMGPAFAAAGDAPARKPTIAVRTCTSHAICVGYATQLSSKRRRGKVCHPEHARRAFQRVNHFLINDAALALECRPLCE